MNGNGPPAMPEHLIVLMMENRSFDHVLGSLTLNGRKDVDGIPTPPQSRTASDGTLVEQRAITSTDTNYDIPHGRATMINQYSGGTFAGFLTALTGVDPKIPMGYYTRSTFPVLHALADEFTVCDRWYASILSSTWPNRKFFHSGTCDADVDTQALPSFPGFGTTPLYAALEKTPDLNRPGHFLSWKCYFSDLPFLAFWYEFAAFHALTNFSHVAQFVDDCRQGTLPTVSIIDPPYTLADDHPPHDPKLGEKFIGLIVDALTTSQSWHDSALLIVYDENGGFFDHALVQPAPPNRFGDTFTGLRVPAILVSPTARKGASHTVYDHTSLMRSVHDRWGVDFDDVKFGDRWKNAPSFWDCLDPSQAPRDPGIYTGVDTQSETATLDWGSGVYDRLGGDVGAFESLLERIFVLPELKSLDQRANVFDILGDLEHNVVTLKRMYKYKSL